MQKDIPADGSPLACDAGSYTIRLQRTIDAHGFTLYITAGSTVIDELTDQFTDETLARHTARTYALRLNAGDSIWALIGDRRDADRELVKAVNATMAEATDTHLAPRREARQAAVEVMGRPVRNTRTHVFAKPLDPSQVGAIRQHRNGVVYAGNGISWVTLRAIVDRGYGTANRVPGRQIITSVTLNQRGLEVANSEGATA
jgi:hypothetical protein